MTSAPAYTNTNAVISEDGRYRYLLRREWPSESGATLGFVMLNPSTADGQHDDPTIRRCVGFARSNGYCAILVANLFAFRATHPTQVLAAMLSEEDVEGPQNQASIRKVFDACRTVVAAWGAPKHALFERRAASVLREFGPWHCLGVTKNGYPKHPLYVRRTQPIAPLGGCEEPAR